MQEFLKRQMTGIRQRGLERILRERTSAQGRVVVLESRRYVNFTSNDYLGLAGDSRLKEAARQALDCYGMGSGASRLAGGHLDEHARLERDVAAWKGTEAALVFSTGYMANAGVIPALCSRGDTVFSDRLNHASIIDGIVLSRARLRRYMHADAPDLSRKLSAHAGGGRRLVVTDTVFSMDGDVAPLREIIAVAREHGAWVMADEAHAAGVLGARGAGLVEETGLQGLVDIEMGTLSKAVGALGGYVAGSRELIHYLVNSARSFTYTTALPACVAAAAREGIRIIQAEPALRERLLGNSGRLRLGLRAAGFDVLQSVTPVIPVLVGDEHQAVELSRRLLEYGYWAPAIRPPTVPAGTARLRLTVTAAHLEEDIEGVVAALVKCRDEMRI